MTIRSAEQFIQLRDSEDPEDYRRAANEDASVDTWLDIIARYPDYRQWVAHNKTVPTEVLDRLSRDPDPRVRWTVSTKRKLTPEILQNLALDEDEGIRASVARHKNTPDSVLVVLAADRSEMVRREARARADKRR